ncbi:hypothetical protein NEF87_003218 [Candidatus Lokiarchaeum ossiferum]|uniref:Uncharacterized protein n=1 Tax=Candidatus Lokiarchaeum ossiferum TaxID=2951803 RepID=A0ABY6HTU1_9ARCH|nr:hypothetical protein NEF87_003218 [Candidatus Lokiarchaeum sp. B-35]
MIFVPTSKKFKEGISEIEILDFRTIFNGIYYLSCPSFDPL